MWRLREMQKFRWFWLRIYETWQAVNGSSISVHARFAGMPIFPHGMKGIFISGAASIGKNCVLFQQVTIGSNTLIDSTHAGAPKIGDNCYIGAGAKIIGNVSVGNNVRIGANAVIYRDVPDDCIVTSGEMRVIKKDLMDNRYYNYPGKWRCYESGRFYDVTDDRLDRLNKIKI